MGKSQLEFTAPHCSGFRSGSGHVGFHCSPRTLPLSVSPSIPVPIPTPSHPIPFPSQSQPHPHPQQGGPDLSWAGVGGASVENGQQQRCPQTSLCSGGGRCREHQEGLVTTYRGHEDVLPEREPAQQPEGGWTRASLKTGLGAAGKGAFLGSLKACVLLTHSQRLFFC